jgi:hypothetical protein
MRAVVSVRLHSAPFPCSEPACAILQLLLLVLLSAHLPVLSGGSARRQPPLSSPQPQLWPYQGSPPTSLGTRSPFTRQWLPC